MKADDCVAAVKAGIKEAHSGADLISVIAIYDEKYLRYIHQDSRFRTGFLTRTVGTYASVGRSSRWCAYGPV
jgi:hypothetical protein